MSSTRSSILGVNILSLKGSLFSSTTTNGEPNKLRKNSLNGVQAGNTSPKVTSAVEAAQTMQTMQSKGPGTNTPFTPTKASLSTVTALPEDKTNLPLSERKSGSESEDSSIRPSTPESTVRRNPIEGDSPTEMAVAPLSEYAPPGQSTGSSQQSISSQVDHRAGPNILINGKNNSQTRTASRSSSPSSRDEKSGKEEGSSTPASSVSTAAESITTSESSTDVRTSKLRRRDSITASISPRVRKPLSMMFSRTTVPEPTVPSVSSSLVHSVSATDLASSNQSFLQKRPKDELSEAFKQLEVEFNKYQSKSGVQKANVVRLTLITFLRKFQTRDSGGITYDELDRRVRVLHRWWTGLLAQLKNRSSNAVSGQDRPIYLEGVVGIMSRPEWRPPHSELAPSCQQVEIFPKSQSTTSLASQASHHATRKSVHNNIKTLFQRTLMETLAFAVEKMGLPTAAGTMVAFSGKVLAYAFYFCNDVAQSLINLWELHPNVVRRVVKAYETETPANMRNISELVVSSFPEHMRPLGYIGLANILRRMKAPKRYPVGTNVDWQGPWVPRWCGKDTDLLFVFLKHYHHLLADYLPPNASNNARLCSPGFVMVMAQTLSVIDSTIHRIAESALPAFEPGNRGPTAATFDDMLANASVPTVPVPNRNTSRPMADNKIVVLLRDLVMQKSTMPEECKEEHISAICLMLHAAIRNTSMFDADSCFALCDLLEEALPLLLHAEKTSIRGTQFIDWDLWFEVLQRMSVSDNNMTELRVICLLYSQWTRIVEEPNRKRALCVDWLLTEAVWDRFFTHWCPMVRAYYMRLICWRCGRFDGNASEVDGEIFRAILLRLKSTNEAHLILKERAEMNKQMPPSSMPCHPAPGRRLIILRNDVTQPPSPLLTFNEGIKPSFLPTLGSQTINVRARSSSSVSAISEDDDSSEAGKQSSTKSEENSGFLKKRFSFIRGWSSSTTTESSTTSGASSPATAPKSEPKDPPTPEKTGPIPTFRFSLEWMNQPPFAVRGGASGPARLSKPAQSYVEQELQSEVHVPELHPSAVLSKACFKYAGRAMAEWIFIVVECENFFERRKAEGKKSNAEVETPSLGVETLKKL